MLARVAASCDKVPETRLISGKRMPMIGLGTWRSPPDVVKDSVMLAIDLGYRHIDCAYVYGNEVEIGQAIAEKIADGTVTREDLFITNKLWNTYHNPKSVRKACDMSLKNMNLEYFDMYMMHWPMGFAETETGDVYPKDNDGKIKFSHYDYVKTWAAMEELVHSNLTHCIGICNFHKGQIQRILDDSTIIPDNIQIECHPYLTQDSLIEFCHSHNILVTAYGALGSAHSPYAKPGEYPILKHPLIVGLGSKYNCSPAQVLLRYQLDRCNIVIPRSIKKEHLEENLKMIKTGLSRKDYQRIHKLNINGRFMLMENAKDHEHYPFVMDFE